MRTGTTTAVAAALLAGCCVIATSAAAQTTESGKEATVKAGHFMFEHRCRSCHADDPDLKSYGPSLIGILGRKAGTVEGFAYSDAMKASGLVWDEATLRGWIADNKGLLPGTRMRHVGVTDTMEQDYLLAYLKTLHK
ncbi:MAG: c-type cytochrome [Hyphomicrobiaceae bacterium]